jgi:hypothetical protein
VSVLAAVAVAADLVALVALGRRWAVATPEGLVLSGTHAWTVSGVAAGLVVLLLLVGLGGRTSWHYPDGAGRDLRLDWVRGLAIVFVVLNHINIPSLFQLVTQETLGPVSGAELFVALSGVVIGMTYRTRSERTDLLAISGALWGRAFTLYRTALVVVLTIFLLTLLPGVDGRVVTTFSDQSTGQSYGLYPNIEHLLDYPVPGFVLRDIVLLRLGPYQFNIMGLYVVLLAFCPLLVVALRRRLVLLALAVSWGLYLLNSGSSATLLRSQFETPFPLLTWQLLFVHGVAVGWYRERLLGWARRWWGRCLVAVLVLGHLAMMFFSLNNPYLSNRYDVRLDLIPASRFLELYQAYFQRPTLGLGRLLDVALLLVTLYALLTAFWKPLAATFGWFLVPLGQATLYVFVLHVYFSLVVANVPGLGQGHVLVNTVAHAVVLALLWLMVKRRFLFSVVPR